jgi:class 3 adenylate cyclase
MAEKRVQRRLAADVAGYSRLMDEDEEGTRAQFNCRLGEVIEPAISDCRGWLFKTTSDGLLVEFGSVGARPPTAAGVLPGLRKRCRPR